MAYADEEAVEQERLKTLARRDKERCKLSKKTSKDNIQNI